MSVAMALESLPACRTANQRALKRASSVSSRLDGGRDLTGVVRTQVNVLESNEALATMRRLYREWTARSQARRTLLQVRTPSMFHERLKPSLAAQPERMSR